jgi:hypothetical protein
MEPSGRKQWQPVADAPAAKPQEQAKSVAVGCEPLPLNLDGKEGVGGSSPPEGGDTNSLQTGMLCCLTCRRSVRRGYRAGTHFGTGGHSRASATSGVALRHASSER